MATYKIVVKKPEIAGISKLILRFECSPELSGLFRERQLWADYGRSIAKVPPSLLVIPLLANVLPVAWAAGADVYVDEIDKTFLQSAYDVQEAFRKLHPSMAFSGRIHAGKQTVNVGYHRGRTATLFSGGVDSVTTYIRHRDEHPDLITVWGSDIGVDNKVGWSRVREHVERFGSQHQADNHTVKSNFKSMLNHGALEKRFKKNWWEDMMHGYSLLGLCAPFSYMLGHHRIYIASSHTILVAWGSNPIIDNAVKWGQTEVSHDGYELSRQQKLSLIVQHARAGHSVPVRVCWKSQEGGNCGTCEKCSRTIVGLLLEGAQPGRFGFAYTPSSLDRIRLQFIMRKWTLSRNSESFWMNIQKSIPGKLPRISDPDTKRFFEWLRHYNLGKNRK